MMKHIHQQTKWQNLIQFALSSKRSALLFYNLLLEMTILKLLSRILIITALISSAYHHLQKPALSLDEFKANYQTVGQISVSYLNFDIPYDKTDWIMGVRIFGLFEVLVALFIIFDDPLGGFLYLASISFELFFLIWPSIVAKTTAKWSFGQLQQLSHLVGLFGVGLILACGGYRKDKGVSSLK